MKNNTAKQIILQLGSFISLYLVVSFTIVLLFGLLNILFPDTADYVYQIESSHSAVRLGIAMLLVFFPIFLWLTRSVNKLRRSSRVPTADNIAKWLLYASLLVAGGAIAVDIVVLINTFLNGELTTRFFAKVLALLLVVGIAIGYYSREVRDYWLTHERQSIRYAIFATLTLLVILGVAFFHVETPNQVREMRIDEQQVSDLKDTQWAVQDYLRLEAGLPENLDVLNNAFDFTEAPEGREPYEYKLTENGFALCATFAHDNREDYNSESAGYYAPDKMYDTPYIVNDMDWRYTAGRYCFEREVRNLPQ